MPDSTLAGVITAAASLFTAASLVITALALLVPILRGTKENKESIKAVHTIVNQQRTDMQRYTRALVTALKEAGVEVPPDQSIGDEPTDAG